MVCIGIYYRPGQSRTDKKYKRLNVVKLNFTRNMYLQRPYMKGKSHIRFSTTFFLVFPDMPNAFYYRIILERTDIIMMK